MTTATTTIKSPSCDNIDATFVDIYENLGKQGFSYEEARRFTEPLRYYINSGRASGYFLKLLANADAAKAARVLVRSNPSQFGDYRKVWDALWRYLERAVAPKVAQEDE